MSEEVAWDLVEERLMTRLRMLPLDGSSLVRLDVSEPTARVECIGRNGDTIHSEVSTREPIDSSRPPADLSLLPADRWILSKPDNGSSYSRDCRAADVVALASEIVRSIRGLGATPDVSSLKLSVLFLSSDGAHLEGPGSMRAYMDELSPAALDQERAQVQASMEMLQCALAKAEASSFARTGEVPDRLATLLSKAESRARLSSEVVAEICDQNPFLVASFIPIAQTIAGRWAVTASGGEVAARPGGPSFGRREAARMAKAWKTVAKALRRTQRRLPPVPPDWESMPL